MSANQVSSVALCQVGGCQTRLLCGTSDRGVAERDGERRKQAGVTRRDGVVSEKRKEK